MNKVQDKQLKDLLKQAQIMAVTNEATLSDIHSKINTLPVGTDKEKKQKVIVSGFMAQFQEAKKSGDIGALNGLVEEIKNCNYGS